MSAAASGRSRLRDTAAGYGWISIALHWITGVAVLVLLFVGSSIASAEDRDGMVLLHTSIALSSYAFLWARIVWRVRTGHPGPLPNQRRSFFLVGKAVHYATLAALALMLVSGPLMVWSGGEGIGMFGWFSIPSPMSAHHALRDFLHGVHATSATVILIAVVLHLGGVYKHAAFDQDGTFGKMLVAAKPGEQAPAAKPAIDRAAVDLGGQ
jgi:cytochrome b561